MVLKKEVKKEVHVGQALYLGRWIDKDKFRAFVYDKKGEEKLADSWEQFENLISSGLWYAVKQKELKELKEQKEVVSDKKENKDVIRTAGK